MVVVFKKNVASRGLQTLCSGLEKPPQWKSVVVIVRLMLVIFGLMVVIFWMTEVINTGVGSRDVYASKNDKKGDIL